MSKLSNSQRKRFAGIICVMGNRTPYDPILKDLLENSFVGRADGKLVLTAKGMVEWERLATLAGLRVDRNPPQVS